MKIKDKFKCNPKQKEWRLKMNKNKITILHLRNKINVVSDFIFTFTFYDNQSNHSISSKKIPIQNLIKKARIQKII